MDNLSRVRLVVGAIGVGIWSWGYSTDNAQLRLYGMGALVLALILRFGRVLRRRDDASE